MKNVRNSISRREKYIFIAWSVKNSALMPDLKSKRPQMHDKEDQ